jgi:predicted Zn-dependent protease
LNALHNAALIGQHLSPLTKALPSALASPSWLDRAKAVRSRNLEDIAAANLIDAVVADDPRVRPTEFQARIEAALQHNPDSLRGLRMLGLGLAAAGRTAKALPYLRRFVALDPSDTEVQAVLARVTGAEPTPVSERH